MAVLRGVQYEASFWVLDSNGNPVTGQASNLTAYVRQYGSNAYSTGAGSIYEVTIGGSGTGEYLYVPTASEMNTRCLTVRLVHGSHKVYPFCAQIWTEDGKVTGIKDKTDRLTFDPELNYVYADVQNIQSTARQQIWTYTQRGLTEPVTVNGYTTGQSPAEQVLATPANKLTTNTSGHVTVGAYASGQSPANYILVNTSNKLLTNTSGHITVGGYATGQSPNELVLATPANKLATDTSGRVTVGTNQDKTGYELSSTERSNIATAVWSATTRTLTSFGTLISDIWSHATRSITGIADAAVDSIWNRLRSATTRPAGSFGYYLDAQISGISGGGGGGGFVGPRTLTFRVRDAANQPVVGALVVVRTVGAALTNAAGELVVAMPEGVFTVNIVARDGLLFDSQQTPATGDGTLTFTGYTRVPPQAQEPGTCVVYVDVSASCTGTLTIVELPRKLSGGKWLVGQTQQKQAIAGRITFDAVPFGATVRVVVPAAKIDTTFTVPEATSYAV